MKYETGDKVQLISGGPEMTVIGIVGTGELTKLENAALKKEGAIDGDIYCGWHNNTIEERGVFKGNVLKKLS